MSSKYSEFFEHLSFLGYEVTPDGEDTWKAVGSGKPRTLMINEVSGGLYFMAAYPNDDTKLTAESVNAINKATWITKFVIIDEKTFTVEAWYPSSYDKLAFGKFFDGMKSEIAENIAKIASAIKESPKE